MNLSSARTGDRQRGDEHLFVADLRKFYRIHFRTESPRTVQKLHLWVTDFGLHCVAAYRLLRFIRRLGAGSRVLTPISLVVEDALSRVVELVHHVRIRADIGPGFFISHASTIYVGRTTIGRNFSLTHNVTVGLGQTEGTEGVPVIGDDVWIGTGSVVSGAIHVGDGATIANGTMLAHSVPPRSLVLGNPARVVMSDYDNARLFGLAPRRVTEPRPNENAASDVGA